MAKIEHRFFWGVGDTGGVLVIQRMRAALDVTHFFVFTVKSYAHRTNAFLTFLSNFWVFFQCFCHF